MNNKLKNIANRIKQLLDEKSKNEQRYFGQSALAYRSGITEQTITNIMKGKTTPNDSTMQAIANTLNVYKEYLTGEIPFKDFSHWIDIFAVTSLTTDQEQAIFNMLRAWGYIVNYKNGAAFISIITPNGDEKILYIEHLTYLLYNFFVSFDSLLLPVRLAPEEVLKEIE